MASLEARKHEIYVCVVEGQRKMTKTAVRQGGASDIHWAAFIPECSSFLRCPNPGDEAR